MMKMSTSEGCQQGALFKMVDKRDDYESDVSDSGTAMGSVMVSSGESSPSSSSMSSPSLSKKGRGRIQARALLSLSPSSGESLEQLYFTPREEKESGLVGSVGVDNSNEGTQLVVPDGVEDMETEGRQESEVEEGGMMMVEPLGNSELVTPTRNPKVRTILETPKKLGVRAGTTRPSPINCRKPKPFHLLKTKGQPRMNKFSQRMSRHLTPSPSMIALRGVQKIALRIVKNRMKPIENLLSSISDSLRLHISKTVKEEIEGAFGELRTFLDERLPVPRSKAKRTQRQPQGPKKICPAKTVDKDEDVQDKQEKGQASGGENETILAENSGKAKACSIDNIDGSKASDNCSTETEATSPSSQPSPQDLRNKRITWANRRIRSATLVEKLKKYMEQQEGENLANTPGKSINSGSSEEGALTPPNSPMSNFTTSPSIPPFTLGMVKIEPVTDDSDLVVPDEGDKVFTPLMPAGSASDLSDGINDTAEYIISADSEPKSKTDQTGNMISPENDNQLLSITGTGLGPEKVFKPELPIRKPRDSIICDVCGKNFLNNSSLKQHVSFHRPQRPYQCQHPNCEKSYKTKSELNRHVIVHAGKKNYECKQCSKKFLRKQYLKTHLLRHSEPLTQQCSLCLKIFVSEQDLNKHNISYHKNGKRNCSSSSSSSNNSADSSPSPASSF